MRDYGKVSPRFWTGPTGKRIRALGLEPQLVALYLLTAPGSTMSGLYYLPLPTLAHETGLTIEGASKALLSLSVVGFAHYETDTETVWVPEMARHQIGEALDPRDKRITGLVREVSQFRTCRFVKDFWQRYREPYHLPNACPFEEPPSPSGGPSEPLRSQEQEQEQEQEHEHLSSPPAEPSSSAATGTKPKRAAKPKAPSEPLPFPVAEALAALAERSDHRFVPGAPGDWTAGNAIRIAGHIRKWPEIGRWTLVGEWLAAGGKARMGTLGTPWASSDDLADAMSQSADWERRQRPPIDNGNVFALRSNAPSVAPPKPPAISQPAGKTMAELTEAERAAYRAARKGGAA